MTRTLAQQLAALDRRRANLVGNAYADLLSRTREASRRPGDPTDWVMFEFGHKQILKEVRELEARVSRGEASEQDRERLRFLKLDLKRAGMKRHEVRKRLRAARAQQRLREAGK